MRLPLSQNRLVAVALVGVVLTAGLTVVLASPQALGGSGGSGDAAASPAADAPPAANNSFTTAVQRPADGESGEDEHEEDEHEEDEHDDSITAPARVVAP